MRRLVIDTATRACSVALFEGDDCIAAFHEDIGRGHAERLVPMIAELPDKGRANIIHVDVGPGSFTGIRVGVSAARALALAWGAECHGYGCLDLVAAMAAWGEQEPLEAFAVVMVGGHGEYFVQSFDADGYNGMQPPVSLTLVNAIARLKAYHFIAGDAAELFVSARGKGRAISILPDAKYWLSLSDSPALPSSPFYVRGPDAKLPGGIIP